MLSITADELPRIMGCNGKLKMPDACPVSEDNPDARDEGTAAHYMAATVFTGQSTIEELVDRKASNGAYMDGAMATHVLSYLQTLEPTSDVELETGWVGQGFEIRGRADNIWYGVEVLEVDVENYCREVYGLHVRDFKYGYTLVEPELNWTMISHAIGYCIKHAVTPDSITLTINQPRPHHPDGKVRSWTISYADLMNYYAQIVATLTSPSDVLTTGNGCDRCRSMAVCPAYRQASNRSHDACSRVFVDDLPNEELDKELILIQASLHTLKNREQALTELAQHRIKLGQVVGDWHNEQGYGQRRWNTGLTADVLKAITGIDLSTAPGTVTPAEAERRGVPKSVTEALTMQPKTAMKLIRESASKRAKRLLKKG